jgi:hypothetical protein
MIEIRNNIAKRRARLLWRIVATTALLALFAHPTSIGAADVAVPLAVQATLTVRILEYDRALKTWAGGAVAIGIVGKKDGSSAEYKQALSGQSAQGVPITAAQHSYRDAETLRGWIEKSGVRFLYVTADLGADAAAVLSAAKQMPTLVATREQFQGGAALGLVVRDGKPNILVNLSAAKAAGMDLDPKLLQLSEVVR